MTNNKYRQNSGFTMVEILIVFTLIAILSAITASSYLGTRRKVRDAKAIADMKDIQKGLELYFSLNSTYPTTLTDLVSGGDTTYFKTGRLPTDQFSKTDYTNFSSDGNNYCLCTFELERGEGGNSSDSSCTYVQDGKYFCVENSQ